MSRTEVFEQAIRRGHSLAWDGKFDQALGEYGIALAECPEDITALTSMGSALLELGRLPEALQVYQAAARYNPDDAHVLARVAQIQELQGQSHEAARTFMVVAEAYLRQRDLDRAAENWSTAARLAPNLAGAHRRLALVYERQGKNRLAVREYLALARILQSHQETDQAIQVCLQAIKLDPPNADALTALDLLRQGDLSTAQAVLEKASEPDSSAMPATETDGGSRWDREAREGAEVDLSPVAPVEDSAGAQPHGLAESARRIALAALAQAIFDQDTEELTSSSLATLISQAIDQQLTGNIPQAIKLFEQALKSGLSTPAARFNLGNLYWQVGWLEQATHQLSLSLQDPVYHLSSLVVLAEVDQARGQIEEMIHHLTEAVQIIDTGNMQPRRAEMLAQAYQSSGQFFKTPDGTESARAFSTSMFELVRAPDWEKRVRQARHGLDQVAEPDLNITLVEFYSIPDAQQVLDLLTLTQQYLARGLVQAAIEECYRAIELAPGFMSAHIRLAQLLLYEGRIDEAAAKYTMMARIAESRGNNVCAIRMFEAVLRISPLDQETRIRLIALLQGRGEHDQAIEHMLALADGYYQLARLDDARRVYRETLKMAARGTATRGWASQILQRMGDMCLQTLDWREALIIYEQLRKLAPDDEQTRLTLIELYFKVGQPDKAVAEVDGLGRLLASHGRLADYIAAVDDLVRQRPGEPALRARLVGALREAGRTDEATAQLDAMREIDNGNG